jgi:hypothetical protein
MLDDPSTSLRLCLFGMGLVFLLFDHRGAPIQAGNQSGHPHPAARLANVHASAAELLGNYRQIPVDACEQVMARTLEDLNWVGIFTGSQERLLERIRPPRGR